MEEYQKTVMRVSTVTLLGNLILAFFKILIGFISFSNAIISDGIHTASDVLSTVVVMVGVKLSSKESDLEDRKSTRLNSSHIQKSRMPSSA